MAEAAIRVTRLRGFERRWAEAMFAAILAPETVGLPAFASIDRHEFWRCVESAPGPLFGVGLRAMVHALNLWPLADARHRRPFVALTPAAQATLVAELAHHGSYAVRQLVTALKMLACLAYFDDAGVRQRVGAA